MEKVLSAGLIAGAQRISARPTHWFGESVAARRILPKGYAGIHLQLARGRLLWAAF
jgi:hypothetical protein